MKEFIVSNDLLRRPDALRARAGSDGYLFFRGLLEPERLARLRGQILALCTEAGWLAPGSNPQEGIAASGLAPVEGEPAFMAVYNRVNQLEDFHALAHHPALLTMLGDLFGETPLAHARNIARIIFPQATQFTTPAHQDYIHIQGTEETWTAWIPLSDCPRELGSLAVLPSSHRSGILPTHSSLGAGGLGIHTDDLPFSWTASDFAAGDVLFFHSLLVHKGLPNVTPDRIRLSVDFRYQGVSQPVVESSFQPHHGQLSWEEVYENWKSPQFQYYWRDLPLHYVEWSSRYHQAAKAEAM